MLTLPIKKEWFDMIISGEKKEEYRQISPYYISRFENLFDLLPKSHILTGLDTRELVLVNGYAKNSPRCNIKATLHIGTGNTKWGAIKGVEYYVLKISEVILPN